MPIQYEKCVKSYLAKGWSLKRAKRVCAISYYKQHGVRPQDTHSALDPESIELFDMIEAIDAALGGTYKKED